MVTARSPWSPARSLSASYRQRLNDLADAINTKIASAAATAGTSALTDQVVAAFQGHEMCSGQEWISSSTIHPNLAGHQAYAQVVIDAAPAVSMRTVATDDGATPVTEPEPSADGEAEGSGQPQDQEGVEQSGEELPDAEEAGEQQLP